MKTPQITVIDIGPGHMKLIDVVRDSVYVDECRRRKVKFLPSQVTRRLVAEVSFNGVEGIALNPFDTRISTMCSY